MADPSSFPPLDVQINEFKIQDKTQAVLYILEVHWDQETQWTVSRRFSEFVKLRNELSNFIRDLPPLPPKEMLSFFRRNNSPEWLESRRERLQVWLQKICKIPFIVQSPLILEFLNVSLKKDIQNVHLPRLMGSVEDESFGISDVLYDVERGIFAIAGRPADALARLDGKISNWRLPWEDPESVVPQGNVSVWRRMTSEELKTRQGKPGSPVAAASSPPSLDGGEADSAQVWGVVDSVTFEQEVMKIAWWFSDGEGAEDSMGTLFVALNDGKMLWYTLNAAAELELRHETQLHDSAITGLFLDIGNHLLLSCGQDKKLIACRVSPKNLESGFEVVSQTTYPKAWLTSLTYAPALQFAFVGTMSGDIVVYDVSQNPAVHVHSFGGEEHSGSIQSLTIAGPPPAAAGEDPEHPEERKESLEEAAAAKKTVTSTDFRIFAGSFDGVVSCWSVPDATHLVSQIKRLVKYTSSPSRPITALAELGDRDLLFAALDNGLVFAYEVSSGVLLYAWQAHKNHLISKITYQKGHVLTCSHDRSVCFWKLSEDNAKAPVFVDASHGKPSGVEL